MIMVTTKCRVVMAPNSKFLTLLRLAYMGYAYEVESAVFSLYLQFSLPNTGTSLT